MKRPCSSTSATRAAIRSRNGSSGVAVSNKGIVIGGGGLYAVGTGYPWPPVLALASLTAPLVNLATHLIGDLGYAGIFLLMTITGVIGIPGTEPVMLFAGFDAYNHTLSIPWVIVAGVAGDVVGASIAYAIGYLRLPRAARAPQRQAASEPRAARSRAPLVRALRVGDDRRLALPAGRPRRIPVRRRRGRDALQEDGHVRDARLGDLGRRTCRDRPGGRSQLAELASPPGVRRLRRRRACSSPRSST